MMRMTKLIKKTKVYMAVVMAALMLISGRMTSFALGNGIGSSAQENTAETGNHSENENQGETENGNGTAGGDTTESDDASGTEDGSGDSSERREILDTENNGSDNGSAADFEQDGAETDESEAGCVTVEANKANEEIVSVILPVIEDRDPFSFFIDPKNILYNSYIDSEDVFVEEGANLLFINHGGDWKGLSSRSDMLNIVNQSTVPVNITITARIDGFGGISLVDTDNFEGSESCDMYLALVDDEGNEIPLSADGEISLTVRLDRAPLEAYAYEYDEQSGEYRYSYQFGDIRFDSYSFGLRGACNTDGDWSAISGRPRVSVSWNVEPIMPERTLTDTISDGDSAEDADTDGEAGEDREGSDCADGDENASGADTGSSDDHNTSDGQLISDDKTSSDDQTSADSQTSDNSSSDTESEPASDDASGDDSQNSDD